MEFKDKVVIVTGSTRGIGKAIALEFARKGAHLVISGRNQELVEKVATEMGTLGSEAIGVAADVSVSAQAKNLIDATLEKFGRIDVLVNNAGVTRDNLLMRMSDEDWDAVIAINLKGAYNCIKAATRTLMKQRSGRVINITSVVGQMGNAGQANYAASKAGMIGLTKSVAKELASRGVLVNAVAPGFIDTDMTSELPDSAKEGLMGAIPLARLGQAEEVAHAVLFLASEGANYITGQVINVDGGMVM
jgi:3-oxoacyl-[acyl-carrier protein] reductase